MQAYAMTEASHQMTSNPLPKHGPHKPGLAPVLPTDKAPCALAKLMMCNLSEQGICSEHCGRGVAQGLLPAVLTNSKCLTFLGIVPSECMCACGADTAT